MKKRKIICPRFYSCAKKISQHCGHGKPHIKDETCKNKCRGKPVGKCTHIPKIKYELLRDEE